MSLRIETRQAEISVVGVIEEITDPEPSKNRDE